MSAHQDHEALSAMADGEVDDVALARISAAWRGDPAVRERWHAYHLIGDVLRSDDLASQPVRDRAFLAEIRARLAAEPVVLAPSAPASPAPRMRRVRWRTPVAVAAGFAAVAGVLVVMRTLDGSASGVPLAAAPGAAGAVGPVAAVARPEPVAEPALVIDRQMLRDARLDRYLAAHQQFAGSSGLGMPSTFLRSATAEAGGR